MAGWVTGGYPGGSVQLESGDNFAWKQAICKLVLHTTETANFPDYPANNAPHVTVHPKARKWRQHRALDAPAWALAVGPVSTNSMGAIQIEIVGYAASVKDLDGEDLAYLIGFIRFILAQTGIQATCTVLFDGGAAYGPNGSVRMSPAAWTAYRGILGHQHVPGNSHWDPGDLPMQAKWLPMIQGATPTPPSEDDEMIAFAKAPDDPRIWVGNGVFRRHVVDSTELADIQYKISTGVLKGTNEIFTGRVGWLGAVVPDIVWNTIFDKIEQEGASAGPGAAKDFIRSATVNSEVIKGRPAADVDEAAISAAIIAAINEQGVEVSAETAAEIAASTVEQIKTLTYKAV